MPTPYQRPGQHPAAPEFLKAHKAETRLLDLLWQNSPLGIVIITPGTDEKHPILIGDCNQVFCDLHGYARDELVGQSLDLVHEVHWTTTVDKNWFTAPNIGETLNGSSLHRHKNGHIFLVEYNIHFIDIDGTRCAIGFDTIALKNSDEQNKLRGISTRWVNAIESSDDGVWEIDVDTRTIWTSARCRMILEKSPHDEVQPLADFLSQTHSEDLESVTQSLESIFQDQKNLLNVEARFHDTRNQLHWLHLRGKVSYAPDGSPSKIFGSMSDVSQRKETDKQLLQARQKAEEANITKSQFLAAMSHEIRTPMNGVLGIASLLKETQLDEEQRNFLQIISDSGDSLLTIIDEILNFSKLEAGSVELEHQAFDLINCLYQAIEVVRPLTVDKNISLLFSVHPDTPGQVYGDQNRLRQVILNLLSNAVKFTHKGEIELSVQATLIDADNDGAPRSQLTLAVRDTGIGIEKENIEKLFDPFSQADASTTRHYGGTGLGLAICSRLVKLMRGKITVDSIPAQGSTFQCIIQLHTTDTPAYEPLTEFLGKTVLVIGPAKRSQTILLDALKTFGLSPYHLENTELVEETLTHQPPFACAFIDLGENKEATKAFARKIKLQHTRYQLPLIQLDKIGANGMKPALDHSFNTKLIKPISPQSLSHALRITLAPPSPSANIPKHGANSKQTEPQHPEKVLLVEDNIVNQIVATRLIQQYGYQTDLAENGFTALDRCIQKSYEIIFMDIQMPGMSGFETVQHIRSRIPADSPQPWIIALTANAMEGDRETCLQAGMDDYISKPIRAEQLEKALKNARTSLVERHS